MVQYLQFRILEFPLKIAVLQFYIGIPLVLHHVQTQPFLFNVIMTYA